VRVLSQIAAAAITRSSSSSNRVHGARFVITGFDANEATTAPSGESSDYDIVFLLIEKQESCAIAKMTAQCAPCMSAMKIFGTP